LSLFLGFFGIEATASIKTSCKQIENDFDKFDGRHRKDVDKHGREKSGADI